MTSAHPETDTLLPISVDEYEFQLVPWLGRRYRAWLDRQVRVHAHDRGIVLIPRLLYDEYRDRPKMSRLSDGQRRRLGVR